MTAPTRKPSLTDLTDDPSDLLPPHSPPSTPGGRPCAVDRREVINTIRNLNRTGRPWDLQPHDLQPNRTVDEYGAPWRRTGTW